MWGGAWSRCLLGWLRSRHQRGNKALDGYCGVIKMSEMFGWRFQRRTWWRSLRSWWFTWIRPRDLTTAMNFFQRLSKSAASQIISSSRTLNGQCFDIKWTLRNKLDNESLLMYEHICSCSKAAKLSQYISVNQNCNHVLLEPPPSQDGY